MKVTLSELLDYLQPGSRGRGPIKVLSLRQPWAWLMLEASPPKDIENRVWTTSYRGPVAVHASKGMTEDEYYDADEFARLVDPSITLPPMEALVRGAIVGAFTVLDVLRPIGTLESRWTPELRWRIPGQFGWKVERPVFLDEPVPFLGMRKLFEVSETEISAAAGAAAGRKK